MAYNTTSYNIGPQSIRVLSDLINVRRITDLDELRVMSDSDIPAVNDNFSYSYLMTATPTGVANKYSNMKVRLGEITYYLNTLGTDEIAGIRSDLDKFIHDLLNNNDKYIGIKYYNDSFSIGAYVSQINAANSYFVDGEYSSYAYTNQLTDGLITNDVLEQYVQSTLGRILGVPNTPAYVSEAIDSVIEFVDWFKGYTHNNSDAGNLQKLIETIERKDEDIINSYKAADQAIVESYIYADTAINRRIDELENDQLHPGTNVTITDKRINSYVSINEDKKKIQFGNISYILSFDNTTGKLSLEVDVDNYSRITLSNVTSSETKYVEYKSSTTAGQKSLSAKTSKPCENTQWNAISPATVTNNQSSIASSGEVIYIAVGKYGPIYNGTGTQSYSWTINATEILTEDDKAHGHTTAQDAGTKTVSVTYNFTHYAYWTAISAAKTNDLNSLTLNKGTINSNGYPNKIYFSSSNWGSGAYIYFLIKGIGSHTFVMGSGTTDGTMAGGIVRVGNAGDYTRYGNIPYTLYRSDAIQTGNCNVKIL